MLRIAARPSVVTLSHRTGIWLAFVVLGALSLSLILTGRALAAPSGLDQTITFGPLPNRAYGDPPFTVSATSSSNLPVTFSATGDCSVSGNTVTLTAAGSCTVTAHQSGGGGYNPAPDVSQGFFIAKVKLVAGYCTEASFDAALAGGGGIMFDCGSTPFTLTLSSQKVIAADTSIDSLGPLVLSGNTYTRVFTIGAGVSLNLFDLTVANGSVTGQDGGGIYNNGALTLTNVTLSGNRAGYTPVIPSGTRGGNGGAVANNGTLAVMQSTFVQNTADPYNSAGGGGAIYNNGALGVLASTFSANIAQNYGSIIDSGGAVLNTVTGTAWLSATLVTGNAAGQYGAGLYNAGVMTLTNSPILTNSVPYGGNPTTSGSGGGVYNSGALWVSGGTFNGNIVVSYNGMSGNGGGIYNSGALTLTGTTFTGNMTKLSSGNGSSGGALYNDTTGVVTATALGAYNNTVDYMGGAVYNRGIFAAQNATFSGNNLGPAGYAGGAVYNDGGQMQLNGALITGNFASPRTNSYNGGQGGGVFNTGVLTLTAVDITNNSADLGGGLTNVSGGSLVWLGGTLVGNSAQKSAIQSAGQGGGLYGGVGPELLSGIVISNNQAYRDGGGACLCDSLAGPVTFTNVLINANGALGGGGGGIYNTSGSLVVLTAVSITANYATGGNTYAYDNGGGIYNYGTILYNTGIISGNFTSSILSMGGSGGGVYNNGTVTLTAVSVVNNQALNQSTTGSISGGGGIATLGYYLGSNQYATATLALISSTVANNYVQSNGTGGNGGGIMAGDYSNPSLLVMTGTSVSANTAFNYGQGGGIYVGTAGDLVASGGVISGNVTSGNYGEGGGIYSQGRLSLDGVDVNGNRAANNGGGIANEGGPWVVVNRSTIRNNQANAAQGKYGGGIYNNGAASALILTDTFFISNAGYYGGGIYNAGLVTATRLTVITNTALAGGGGLYNDTAGSVWLSGSAVATNTATLGDGGGGLYNRGVLSLTTSSVLSNTATGIINFASVCGGGINNSGVLTLTQSTVAYNAAVGNSDAACGGGLFNGQAASLVNVTVSGNRTVSYTGNTDSGGGVTNKGTLTLLNATIANNQSTKGGGLENAPSFSLAAKNTIVAQNVATATSANCLGTVTSQGHNLDGGSTCLFTASGDLSNTNPLLGPLADNGGGTWTQALRSGSPAVDHADNTGCPATDQRGVSRPQGATCDIGAFELPTVDLAVTNADWPDPVGVGFPLTYTVVASNLSAAYATGVVLTDTLPAGVTAGPAHTSQGVCSGTGVVVCNGGVLGSGGRITLTLVVTPSAAGILTNNATVMPIETDPALLNNSAVQTTTVLAGADLAVGQAPSQSPLLWGDALTYTLFVTNYGALAATNVWVTDTFPAGANPQSITPSAGGTCNQAAAAITCSISTLAAGQSVEMSLSLMPTLPGVAVNVVDVSADQFDPDWANNHSVNTVDVIALADLALGETAVPDPAHVGQPLTYTLVVTNLGPSAMGGIVVTDVLPAGLSLSSVAGSQGACTATITVTCDLDTLANGGVATVTLVVTPTVLDQVDNTAVVTGDGTDPDGSNNSASRSVTIYPSADLVASLAAAPDPVLPGAPLTYTLVVTNRGPSPASALRITDSLPAGALVNTYTSTIATCAAAGDLVTCSAAGLTAGDSLSVTLVVTAPPAIGMPVNVFTATAAEFDPWPADNTASLAVTVNAADMQIAQSITPDPPRYHQPVTYTLAITNAGPSNATGVVVSDTFGGLPIPYPVVISPPSASQGSCSQAYNFARCDLGAMPSGASAAMTLVVTLNETNTAISTAVVVANELDPQPLNNMSVYTTAAVKTPIVSVWITGTISPAATAVSRPLTYTYVISNAGPDALSGAVLLTDVIPAGAAFANADAAPGTCDLAAGALTCSLPSAPATVTLVLTPTAPGTLANTATITVPAGVIDSNAGDNGVTLVAQVNPLADLALSKSASPGPAYPGQPLTYTLAVTNLGPSAASGVVVTDVLPAGLSLSSASSTQGACAGTVTVTCGLGTLASGGAASVTLVATPTQAGLVVNTAIVSGDAVDPDPANNTASRSVTVDPSADLGASLTAAPDPVLPGAPLTYTLVVANRGPSPASALRITDSLPAGALFNTYTSTIATCTAPGSGSVICSAAGLAVDDGLTVTLVVTAPPAIGMPVNVFTATATEFDPWPTDNSSAVSVTVTPAVVDVSITGSVYPAMTPIGQPLTYTYVISNAGPDALAGAVVLTDVLPAPFGWANASSGACRLDTNTTGANGMLACSLPSLPVTVTLVLTPTTHGTLANTATVSVPDTMIDSSTDNNSVSLQAMAVLQVFVPIAMQP